MSRAAERADIFWKPYQSVGLMPSSPFRDSQEMSATGQRKNPGRLRGRGYRVSQKALGGLLANGELFGSRDELLKSLLTGEEVQAVFEPDGVVKRAFLGDLLFE